MEQLINFIIRPPRAEYNPKNDLLDQEFMLKGKWFQRKDLELVNSRGDVLQCSHYLPIVRPEGKALPCVIYCHGNSGCRSDASEAAIILLPSNITVFTLDFSGSGVSGGEYVSLGWYEKDDLKAVVNYLREDGNISLIGLWGRSMGAVTSLMYGAEDPSIAGMVLDSPFSDLVDLMMELVDTYKFRLPNFAVKMAIQYMRKSIQKKAKFDITELNTIKVAKSSFVPVLIGHAIEDDFIQPHHSDRIFDAYMGDKNIIKFEGDHNSPRPQFYFDSINIFFHNVLQPPEDEVSGNYLDASLDYFDRGLRDVGYEDDFLSAPIASSSTEDAINQLRSKRPMSRTEVPTDKQSDAKEEGSGSELPVASSSRMINFEFSNSHSSGPHFPASIEDDEYVEYPLHNLPGVPCDVDEEERMFMEAVIESLKDMETKSQPQVEEQQSSVSTPEPSQNIKKDESLTKVPTNLDNGHDLASQFANPDIENSSTEAPLDSASSTTESPRSMGASTGSNKTSVGIGSSSEADMDMVDRTKATVTVVKNPSGNIMDGLLRRWDLNFFKNR